VSRRRIAGVCAHALDDAQDVHLSAAWKIQE
jgi:hypothetical protein